MPKHRARRRAWSTSPRGRSVDRHGVPRLSGATGVSEAVAAHVREVALPIGYVANVHARTLAGGATRRSG